MKIGLRTVKTSLNIGGVATNVVLVLLGDPKKKDLHNVLKQLDRYNKLSSDPIVYEFLDDRKQEALSQFKRHYGDDFYEAIKTNQMVFKDDDLMAYLLYIPEERSVFVLSEYDQDGAQGAKIFLDEDFNIARIEQKNKFGPFKNAGEYFGHRMREVITWPRAF